MNVLITNSQEPQAYTILRSVRPAARRVVITTGNPSVKVEPFRGMAFYSRLVDKRYEVPAFASDWSAGRIQAENTALEEAYIRRIEEICRAENINAVFPSLDPEVYVFSKNKDRLADHGIVVVVPDYDVLLGPMDKARTLAAAERVGFPYPKTFFPRDVNDVEGIVRDSAPLWVVKPRLGAHGVNVRLAETPEALCGSFRELDALQAAPIVQEYIPGASRRNYYITVSPDSELVSMLSPEVRRTHSSGVRVACKTVVSSSAVPLLPELRALVKELRLCGAFTVQTKIDPTDGRPKLLEINARFGHHLWYRTELGVNEPMICLQLAHGERPTGSTTFPDGVMMLDPFHDICFLYARVLDRLVALIRTSQAPDVAQRSIADVIRECRADYFDRRRKILSPEARYLFSDPVPCVFVFGNTLARNTYHAAKRLFQFERPSAISAS